MYATMMELVQTFCVTRHTRQDACYFGDSTAIARDRSAEFFLTCLSDDRVGTDEPWFAYRPSVRMSWAPRQQWRGFHAPDLQSNRWLAG